MVVERLHLVDASENNTVIQLGDEICLMDRGSRKAGIIMMFRGRGGPSMTIRSETESSCSVRKFDDEYTAKEAQMLAIGLATGSGLALEEAGDEKYPIFRFVEAI